MDLRKRFLVNPQTLSLPGHNSYQGNLQDRMRVVTMALQIFLRIVQCLVHNDSAWTIIGRKGDWVGKL